MPAPARSCNFRAGIFDGMDLASPGILGSPSGAGQGGESGRPAAWPRGLARFALISSNEGKWWCARRGGMLTSVAGYREHVSLCCRIGSDLRRKNTFERHDAVLWLIWQVRPGLRTGVTRCIGQRSPVALYQEESLLRQPALLPHAPRAIQGGGVAVAMPP